ncbi:UDP-N-acetylmuramate--L-alanine ligase [Fulvivirga maritima]|uniref:UDP-N-acetylmuramate--L-alanine ligase n=1 Tax=Fulvivirga maritima TaxID=2904247 RepID=UPI001F31367D|nr:UDP-N-acetylmuramate--L-alanine ligase [Fulvivirga maritima]UII29236.1 UDP-N-acetylmuramate--L-alanine ligase [Fulvivirga maritima]
MKLDSYHSVYFIGVGGIGMSALARWFAHNGYKVSGYDRTPTALTQKLEEEGVAIHYEDKVENIPAEIIENKEKSLVIYTPAIPASHKEYNHLKDHGYEIKKRSAVLGLISEQFFTVAVAGTHGKTTTSSMVSHILKSAGKDITVFLGGIATNYNSNFIANNTDKAVAVVEADEFDRSFLTLSPDLAVVTSADADHLDIYGDKDKLQNSFKDFIHKLRHNGKLYINDKIAKELVDDSFEGIVNTYGMNRGQFFASNVTMNNGFFQFDYQDAQSKIERLMLGVPGFHNVENVTAAIAIGLELGLSEEDIRKGVESYRGVKRRFEYVLRSEQIVFVDDYAHHPVEITAFLSSLKALYPDRKVTAIFQPHLFTRTRDFAVEFSESLSLADEVILLDIYPAREEPIEGVSSELLLENITIDKKELCTKEQLINNLEEKELEVVATIGAGDIDKLVEPIKEMLKGRYHV